VVALSKIDLVLRWKTVKEAPTSKVLTTQSKAVINELEKRIYPVAGKLSQRGFQADLYIRIKSFAKTLAIVPVNDKSGEGIPGLLMLIVGLTQVYLRDRLAFCED
jgi:translation initiation factor IF-2